ncbi:Uncharacterised protein [Salmonella enterica subsp. enterica]|uniref:Uncharacterized protein n=1 Tax=Salmonella enterica I TaxID=59201 RepID=A0A379X0S0_SALET|nr:Uncharacterised protein [Salmonella enterica subsp. enterica]
MPAGKASDPLRSDILNGLRASYIGDSNSLTLNGPLPTVKFIVEDLCARKIMLTFWVRRREIKRVFFIHDDANNRLRVVLKKSPDGVWRPQPENNLLTQQSKVSGGYYSDGTLRETDLAQLAQACGWRETPLTSPARFASRGDGESAYWTLTRIAPLPACAMPISSSLAGTRRCNWC